jgi:hypothetical protein
MTTDAFAIGCATLAATSARFFSKLLLHLNIIGVVRRLFQSPAKMAARMVQPRPVRHQQDNSVNDPVDRDSISHPNPCSRHSTNLRRGIVEVFNRCDRGRPR